MKKAQLVGAEKPPEKVYQTPVTLTPSQVVEGLEQYRNVYFKVWERRGVSNKRTADRWDAYMIQEHAELFAKYDFLDEMLVGRRA